MSVEVPEWLCRPLTTIALCWRIERRDGVAIGLTAHDRDLLVDGFWYRAAPGMTPSAIRRGGGLDPDTMDVTGALSGVAISEVDLLAGRWDGAQVRLFAVDWTAPNEVVELGGGTIGAVETRDGVMTSELRGLGAALDAPVVEMTAPECRAELGDKRCRVPLAALRQMAKVIAADGPLLTLDGVSGDFAGGRIRCFSGANCGLSDHIALSIAVSGGVQITLHRPPRFDPLNAQVEVIAGCDKSIATCASRFNNAVNFRGEPYLPGMDLLTRYPGL